MARTTIPAELVAINAIQGTLIADNAITAVHIATNAVSGTLVADNAITSTHIAQNNVTATQIAQNTITVTQMADSAIETAKINNDAVTQAKIADDAVGPDQLAANAVVSASIANGTIVEADMADNAVTLAKMASLARGSIIYGDSAGDPAALSIGSNGTVLKSDGTDVSWGTVSGGVAGISTSADATAITIDSSERVGIGTTSPDVTLHVANAGDAYFKVQNTSASKNFQIITGGSGARVRSDDALIFDSGSSPAERMRVASNGNVGIGITNPSHVLSVYKAGDGQTPVRFNTGNNEPLDFYNDSETWKLQSGQGIGLMAKSTGVITFMTTDSETERMRITNAGRVGQGTTSPSWNYDMIYSHATLGAMRLQNQGSFGTYNTLLQVDTFNSASANFQYLVCHSGNGSAINDIEFNLRGDANAYADGSWSGGGADYAEYFEWEDGNSSNEDRIGHSVSLVGNKIKIAESGETVIGVISGNPAVVGDTGWNKWHDKYQKDDYGRYLRDESGHKLVNTDYNDTKEYVTRESRKEWDIVGLMGKLRIKKGQQTGTNWIKMRDISASVEEWLIR